MRDRSWVRVVGVVVSTAVLGCIGVAGPAVAAAKSAPAGFANQVVNTYRAEYAAARTLGRASALTPVSGYRRQVEAMSPGELDALYRATAAVPAWSQIPTLLQSVAASGAPTAAGAASLGGFQPANCSSGPPASAVFATQIVLDAASAVFNILATDGQLGNKISFFISAGTAVVISAAAVVHDTLVFLQGDAADCAASNTAGYLASIDDATVQAYRLNATIADTISSMQTVAGATAQSVQALQTTVAGLQTSGTQLLQDQATIQSALGGDVAALTTQLDANRSAIQADVSKLSALETANRAALGAAVDNGATALQGSVTSALNQTLDEIDSDAQALGALLSGNLSQLMAALSADRSTARNDAEQNLTLDIEEGLASSSPQLQLKLPASVGGYLDSTPVGVQSVVRDAIQARQATSPQAASSATQLADAAQSALAARDYFHAFADFQQSYLALAGA